jgi:hypothetical protein
LSALRVVRGNFDSEAEKANTGTMEVKTRQPQHTCAKPQNKRLHDCNIAIKCEHMALLALQLQRYPLPLTLTEPTSCYNTHHEIQHAAIPRSTHTETSCYSVRTSEQTAIISQYKVKVFFYTMLPDFATAVLFT